MRRPIVLVLSAAIALSAFAKNKSKSDLNRAITHARFIMLTTPNGVPATDTRVPPEDVHAFNTMDQALKRWGRYIVVYTPEQAELIMIVRAGRLTGTHVGIAEDDGINSGVVIGRVPPGQDRTGGAPIGPSTGRPAVVYGAEVGPPDDMLEIFDGRLGMDSSPLWRKLQKYGLTDVQGTAPPLLKELRKEVEAADKEDADNKKKP